MVFQVQKQRDQATKTRNLLWLRQRVWEREIGERDLGKQAEYLQKLIETISCRTKHLLSKADDTANTRSSTSMRLVSHWRRRD